MGFINDLFFSNNKGSYSKESFQKLVNDLVTEASNKITRPDFLYDMKSDSTIVNGMITVLDTKKNNAYNEEEYFMSLADNNCYFLVQDEFVNAWLLDMMIKYKLYSKQEAQSTFNLICEQSRKIVRGKASEAYLDAAKKIDAILAQSTNSPVFQMESYYITLRLRSDIYCSLFEEMYSSAKYEKIFSDRNIPVEEKHDYIIQSILNIIKQKENSIKKVLYR